MSEEQQSKARVDENRRDRDEDEQGAQQQKDIEIPAIRHIGKTLESDPEYYAVASPGYSTPEAQIAADRAEDAKYR